jgi:hypothetical protein
MGQAFLRYQSLQGKIEYNGVLMMFAPSADLWRDINVIRRLGQGWRVQIVMPRFLWDGKGVTLVPSPYPNPVDVYSDNRDGLSPRLRIIQ